MRLKIEILLFLLLVTGMLYAQSKPLYTDASLPIDVRVEDLLSRMTLEEKVGQLNMPCVLQR